MLEASSGYLQFLSFRGGVYPTLCTWTMAPTPNLSPEGEGLCRGA